MSLFTVLQLLSYNIVSDLVDDLLMYVHFLKQFYYVLPIY